MTNEKITEILDRCNGRFGWVQIHIDTAENYLLMPLTELVEILEKQIPKKPVGLNCPRCGFNGIDNSWWVFAYCPECGQAIDWSDENET